MKTSEKGKGSEASKSKASIYNSSCLEYCLPDEDAGNLKGGVNFWTRLKFLQLSLHIEMVSQ